MTVIELINALENLRGGYDDPVVLARPVVGRGKEIYEAVDFQYEATVGADGLGQLKLILSKQN